MKGRRVLVFALAGMVGFLSGGWLLQRNTSQSSGVYEKARLFEDIIAHIAEHSVDTLDERQLYEMAIDGLIDELDDPYAAYLAPGDFDELRERTRGTYGGLGMQIDVRDGWITVIAPIADTPAEAAGIESGDRIVQVGDESTSGWRNEKAVMELRGEPGTEVTISVARPGVPEPFEVTLTRAVIQVRSVRAAMMLTPEIGYVSLAYATIGETVVDEVRESVGGLRDQGAASMILDFRDNPGGLLEEGVDLVDLFLGEDVLIVETRGRSAASMHSFSTRSDEEWPGMPIVVLVNGGTASAAEILAGALQDHDRSVILGTPTFGKGLVQTVFPVGPSQAFQLTTGRWYTPSGRTIQRPIRQVDGALRIVGGFEEEREDLLGDTTVVGSGAVFYTDSGRPVIGGGGIRPDITMRLDTLSDGEKTFVRALGSQIPVYRDVLTSYALEAKGGGDLVDPGFSVSWQMRSDVVNRLRERGVVMSDAVARGAARLLDRQIGYEVTRYVFGRGEEARRRTRDDAQVQEALRLLEGVNTPEDLFARVQSEREGDALSETR
jgi:carboxyl-terminal processing protease